MYFPFELNRPVKPPEGRAARLTRRGVNKQRRKCEQLGLDTRKIRGAGRGIRRSWVV